MLFLNLSMYRGFYKNIDSEMFLKHQIRMISEK